MTTLIAFDLDGVLYSSEPFIADAYREAMAAVNEERPGSFARVPSTREILDHVGWPVATILARLFPAVAGAAVDRLQAATLEVICGRVAARAGVLYEGVAEGLRALHQAGHLLAVASNGRHRYVETVLATYGLSELFVAPITADQVGSKPAVLGGYLERHRLSPAYTVMVGDRASDVEAARVVGCHFIGCDYGHGHRHEIEGAGPTVSRFGEVPAAVAYLLHA
ncbi:MAG: HAD family hydrolase [Deltaproteobacteria bacterium]|nr:HAD family hydrolase [Deltaproteobacteria bacterium]